MSLENFITDILNIDYDRIEKISAVDIDHSSVSVYVRLKPDPNVVCPLCHGKVKIRGYHQKKLVHSTLVNRPCMIYYDQRRYSCPSCEFSFHEQNPFSAAREQITYETKLNVLIDLKYPGSTYTAVARRLNLQPMQVIRIFDKHVDIPRKTLPAVLSIDEHHMPSLNQDSIYICILMDFSNGMILDVLPDRKKDYLSYYFMSVRNTTLDDKTHKSELDNVKYISIDFWEPYKEIAKIYFPHAVICGDSFHALEHLTNDFRAVRLKCRRNTEDEDLKYLLTKFKFVFDHGRDLDNKGKYNKRFRRYMNYRDIINILFERFPELKAAYDLKESYITFNQTANSDNARKLLAEQIKLFAESGIEEFIEFYNLMVNWSDEIVNSFSIVDNKRINNSYIESRNNQIEKLILNANGFTNFKRTRNRILYCLNKNDTFKI